MQPLTIGLAFNLKRIQPNLDPQSDTEAEYDSPTTIAAIRGALEGLGHRVIEMEANSDFPRRILEEKVDLVFNIAEGLKGRNRESQIPALLELLGIPYTGSDPTTLSIAMDKGLAKRVVGSSGLATAAFQVCNTGHEPIRADLRFPLILKPVAEGSSKGVIAKSVVQNEPELRELAQQMLARYQQPVMIESYLPGREFTVGIVDGKLLPIMEIVFLKGELPVYSYQHKLDAAGEVQYQIPAKLEGPLQKAIEDLALGCYEALGCRDVARMDIRLDLKGKPHFIECNPLPGLTPGWSDLCLIAKKQVGPTNASLHPFLPLQSLESAKTKAAVSRKDKYEPKVSSP